MKLHDCSQKKNRFKPPRPANVNVAQAYFVQAWPRGVQSIDRWRQMPFGKSWGKVKKIENQGEYFLVADFLQTHNRMRQFCVQQFKNKFLGSLRSQIICMPIPTFKFVLPPLFDFTILTAYSQFGQLILRKIIIIVVTRCHILMLKFTKFDFGWGSIPDPLGELTSLPQTLSLHLKGPTFNTRKKKRRKGRREERKKKQGGKEK